jgi:ABC-type siderophore export system fused ATPase/permease subunit
MLDNWMEMLLFGIYEEEEGRLLWDTKLVDKEWA